MPTQSEYNMATQSVRDIKIKMNLLNHNFQNVAELEGNLTEMPSFTIDANSDIRRTCNISLIPTDSSFDIKHGNKIWLDKYIKILYGQKNIATNEYEYTNMGIYMIDNPNKTYSATNNLLTFQGIDLMARMTGLRNGNLKGLPYLIPQGANVRLAFIAILDMCGFTKYSIDECTIDVPNDILVDIGGTAYDLLKELRDILPNYQIYFDVDGVFHYNKIPSGKNEPIMIDNNIWEKNLLSYQKVTNFEALRNSIEVYGKTHDIKNYGGVATTSGSTYEITVSSLSNLYKYLKIGFSTNENLDGDKQLKINMGDDESVTYPIKKEDGSVPIFSTDENKYYVVKYMYGEDQWEFVNTQNIPNPKVATIINGDTYNITDADITEYTDEMVYTFKTPSSGCDSVYIPKFQINGLKALPIYNTVKLRNDITYTIKLNLASLDESQKYFMFMGEATPYGQAQELNPSSPFYINGTLGEVRQVLSGGEYDNIFTTDLAIERANWELYTRCRLQDSITIDCIPIPWIDVNWLIEIKLPNKSGDEELEKYMINSISINGGINGTMSVTLSKYYSFYDEE